MTYRGIVNGKTIELNEPLPYRSGQEVAVAVEAVLPEPQRGSPAAVLNAMAAPPHLAAEAVEQMLRALRDGQLPVRSHGAFDEPPAR